jgi:hypothetical protein
MRNNTKPFLDIIKEKKKNRELVIFSNLIFIIRTVVLSTAAAENCNNTYIF